MNKGINALLILLCLIITSCEHHENDKEPNTRVNLGTVKGVVTTPSNKVVSNATVFYDNDGDLYLTKTNAQGVFQLELPPGNKTIEIQSGNGKLFRSSYAVNVTSDVVLDLTAVNLRLDAEANFAFVGGLYDNIETIIQDLGYTVDELTKSDLEAANSLDNYDALFLNCDANSAEFPDLFYQNLSDFVTRGGSVYASDWALEYLIGYKDYTADCITPTPGGFIDDALICGTRTGAVEILTGNTIVDQDLLDYTSLATLDIEYDLGAWMQLQYVDMSFWDVLIEDQNQNPLMIKTSNLVGSVNEADWYSDNGNKVTICHTPPGNPDNAHAITISVNALDAHLAHGDSVGPCDATSGNIYYTTFHNHVDGNSAPEIMTILEYMVLNL